MIPIVINTLKKKITKNRQYYLGGYPPGDWVSILAVIYLVIPIPIFLFTHLKIYISIPLVIFVMFTVLRIVKSLFIQRNCVILTYRELFISLLILLCWVFFSGIGGLAFQNSDFDTRNAILRDLISNSWPVIYEQNNVIYGLIYYNGFWLPSALIGKAFGWNAANLSLFIWSLIGVFFTVVLIKKRLSSSLIFSTMLLILFSGMDIIGVGLLKLLGVESYPFLWPPISHLEWWAGLFQYSSFTTQLYWVFNQAIPCWIIMGLLITNSRPQYIFFLASIAFFYAPLPFFGIFPFLIITIYKSISQNSTLMRFNREVSPISKFTRFIYSLRATVSVENILSGGSIFAISALYFSTNVNTSSFSIIDLDLTTIVLWTLFIIFEFLILWVSLRHFQTERNIWLITGILLLFLPFIKIGDSWNFEMRASIPLLFIIMIWSGEALVSVNHKRLRNIILIILFFGSITPIYEINRSIFRTISYYSAHRQSVQESTKSQLNSPPVSYPPKFEQSEVVHPGEIVADEYLSLTYFSLSTLDTIVAPIQDSYFFTSIARKKK